MDLTRLGTGMGKEYITTVFTKYFSTIIKARTYAENHYNGSRGPIKWSILGNRHSSGDLGYIMYEIAPIKIDE